MANRVFSWLSRVLSDPLGLHCDHILASRSVQVLLEILDLLGVVPLFDVLSTNFQDGQHLHDQKKRKEAKCEDSPEHSDRSEKGEGRTTIANVSYTIRA